MNTGPNETPVEVIKEGALGETYFRDIDPGINGKCYRKSRKEFDQLKVIDQNTIAQNILMLVLINMVLNVGGRLILQILIVGFSGILDTSQVEVLQTIKGKLIDERLLVDLKAK